MNKVAVLTGDIVESKKITGESSIRLLETIQETFTEIEGLTGITIPFEIWRGDSFQALVEKPEMAMMITILFRAGLKSKTERGGDNTTLWDVRIGIGVGDIAFRGNTVAMSKGEAFVLSGAALDTITKSRYNLCAMTPWKDVNEELSVSTALADVIVSGWTQKQAEAIYLFMLYDYNQVKLAERLNISQPALQKRINEYGNFYRLDLFIKRYKDLVVKYAY